MKRCGPAVLLGATLALAGCGSHREAPQPAGSGSGVPVSSAPPSPDDDSLARLIVREKKFGTAPQKLGADAERLARERLAAPRDRDAFVYYYYVGYESTLESRDGEMTVGLDRNDASNQGVRAGQSAARADLSAGTPKATLLDFGFTPADVKGKLRLEFESQELLPEGLSKRWWVAYNPELDEAYDRLVPSGKADPKVHVDAHLIGLLGPVEPGGVGHLNRYERKLVVTKIVELKSPPP